MKKTFRRWIDGDIDLMENITRTAHEHDMDRDEIKKRNKQVSEIIRQRED